MSGRRSCSPANSGPGDRGSSPSVSISRRRATPLRRHRWYRQLGPGTPNPPDLRVGSEVVMSRHGSADRNRMAYIVERKDRFYVVTYDGIDPITRRQRKRWHAAGDCRIDADAIAAQLTKDQPEMRTASGSRLTLGRFMNEQWMPRRRRELTRRGEQRMSIQTKPSIVFAHGIWADGSSFSKVIRPLWRRATR
jgi:hypothetical protein